MSLHTLPSYYPDLTPWERVPLIVAAAARGDQREWNRLTSTAPGRSWERPDYFGVGEALRGFLIEYLLLQLDHAALLWEATLVLSECKNATTVEEGLQARQDLVAALVRLLARAYVSRADGFRQCCRELHLDGEWLLRDLPGFARIQSAEEAARKVAFTDQDARAFVTGLGEGTLSLELGRLRRLADLATSTPQEIAAVMLDQVRQRAKEMGSV